MEEAGNTCVHEHRRPACATCMRSISIFQSVKFEVAAFIFCDSNRIYSYYQILSQLLVDCCRFININN